MHPARVELTTSAFGGQRSIQLSYECVISIIGNSISPARKFQASDCATNEVSVQVLGYRLEPTSTTSATKLRSPSLERSQF